MVAVGHFADGDAGSMKGVLLSLGLVVLFGCDAGSGAVAKLVPEHADRYARDYIGLIARGQIDSAELKFAAGVPHDTARALLVRLNEMFVGADLDSAELVGTQVTTSYLSGGTTQTVRRLGYLAPAREAWVHLVLVMSEGGGYRQLTGLHFNVYTADPRITTRFALTGKPFVQYLFVLFGLGCFAVAVGSAVWVVRQRDFPRRWLWAPVALIGVGTADMSWATGAFARSFFDLQLFCFAAYKAGPIDPWVFGLAFPAGAVLAVSRVRAWRAMRAPAPLTPITPS
jgi:hypothetical protein